MPYCTFQHTARTSLQLRATQINKIRKKNVLFPQFPSICVGWQRSYYLFISSLRLPPSEATSMLLRNEDIPPDVQSSINKPFPFCSFLPVPWAKLINSLSWNETPFSIKYSNSIYSYWNVGHKFIFFPPHGLLRTSLLGAVQLMGKYTSRIHTEKWMRKDNTA